MAVFAIVRAGGSIEDYLRVREALDFDVTPPDGLILHTIADLEDGLRAFDVWESPQAAQDFYEDRLRPAVARLAPANSDFPSPEIHEVAGLVRP